jgi:hypothetical protein
MSIQHCFTSRKVAGSIPDGVFEVFHSLDPYGRTVPLGVKGFQPCTLHVPTVWKPWEPQPPGAPGAYLALYRDSFTVLWYFTETMQHSAAAIKSVI